MRVLVLQILKYMQMGSHLHCDCRILKANPQYKLDPLESLFVVHYRDGSPYDPMACIVTYTLLQTYSSYLRVLCLGEQMLHVSMLHGNPFVKCLLSRKPDNPDWVDCYTDYPSC